MVEKWIESFYKYRHIYNFIGRSEKCEEDIKTHLMNDLGIRESTARYQLQGALDKECGLVTYVNGKYRIASERVEKMVKCLLRLYPMVMRVIPERKWDYFMKMADDYELKILRLQIQLAEMEIKYHKAEIVTSYKNYETVLAHRDSIPRLEADIKRFQSRIERMKEKKYE